jgi:retron-type reverse transcriptase
MSLKKRPDGLRPLTIVSTLDKIVATAIKIIFTFIFENSRKFNPLPNERCFQDASHGFRSGRSCHTALNTILRWELTTWFIKADIKNCYNTIDQKRLMSILDMSIKDQFLRNTLYKIFQSPVKDLNKNGPDCSKGVGVPQGNPISPVLANLYLNELDHFMVNLKKELNKSNARDTLTPEWTKASELSVAKANLKVNLYRKKVKFALKSEIQKNTKADESRSQYVYHRIFYVRYADDYVIGVKGPKSLAFEIKKCVSYFLESGRRNALQ